MSRIGKLPITVPTGVTVTVEEGNNVLVKGPSGTLSQQVHPNITLKQDNGILTLERPDDVKANKSMHGLYRTLINNMVVGVTAGFQKDLVLVGTGYRAASEGGKKLTLNVGYSHPVVFDAPADVTFETPDQTHIKVKGMNKQVVGNLAADIRAVRPPEPYLGKGIKYADEVIRRKVGKTGK